jgi:predicted dehydrogenase
LGGGFENCQEIFRSGVFGEIVGAQAYMLGRGPEPWHPDPDFFYQRGGGPLFDMGPYYLSALSVLVGPIRRVAGAARVTFPTRTVGSGAKKGQTIQVNTPTHLAAVLNFENGAVGSITTSFDVSAHKMPPITLHGTKGSMLVGDPNSFGDRVHYRKDGDQDWRWVPLDKEYAGNSRGLGVLDMMLATEEGRAHRASGDLAFHVLDVMHAVIESSEQSQYKQIESDFARPEPLPAGFGQ